MDNYDYIIVGAGISGCSVAYELSKYANNILLIDKNKMVASEASGAAGAFLSPLLGKKNNFKDLVTKSLKYSLSLYKKQFPFLIDNCGTTRIPKDDKDREKFKDYIPFMDFNFQEKENGYFFNIGTVVNSIGICKAMATSFINNRKSFKTKFDYNVDKIFYDGEFWILNDEIKTKNIILTTGKNIELLDESYLKVRPVWGKRIDIATTTNLTNNYHKECSVSKSFKIDNDKYKVSIGATHHRDVENLDELTNDSADLLKKANDIISLDNVEIIKEYIGARACSYDYSPIVGEVINSKKTLDLFPSLKNGTKISDDKFIKYKNLFILNGVGGRGFVLAPYLAKQLVDKIINNKDIDKNITVDRLFKKDVRRVEK